MGTVKRYTSEAGREEGWEARDSWVDALGKRHHRKEKFPAGPARKLKQCEQEARAWLAKREAGRARGEVFELSSEPLGAAMDRWLATLPATARSENTIAQYASAARNRFDDATRATPLRAVTTAQLRRLTERWTSEGLSPQSVQRGIVVLHGVFKMVIEERGLVESPMIGITAPPIEDVDIVTWTPAQVDGFLTAHRDHPWAFAFELMFVGMLRIGEVTALRWDDIDPDTGYLEIRRTWSRDANRKQVIVERAKTKAGDRVVPLPAAVLARLDAIRDARDWDDGGWICSRRGQALTPGALSKQWQKLVDVSTLPRITPHGARHTGATNLIDASVPVSSVQRLLGHTDPAFTLKRYVHPRVESLAGAIEVLGSLYKVRETTSRVQGASEPELAALPIGTEKADES